MWCFSFLLGTKYAELGHSAIANHLLTYTNAYPTFLHRSSFSGHPWGRFQRKYRQRRSARKTTKESIAVATARTHQCLRYIFGLSDFDADNIEKAGNKVRPGSSPRNQGCATACVDRSYRLLWWYWQAMKRNHVLLSPFMATYVLAYRFDVQLSLPLFLFHCVRTAVQSTTCLICVTLDCISFLSSKVRPTPRVYVPFFHPAGQVCGNRGKRDDTVPLAYMLQPSALRGGGPEYPRDGGDGARPCFSRVVDGTAAPRRAVDGNAKDPFACCSGGIQA